MLTRAMFDLLDFPPVTFLRKLMVGITSRLIKKPQINPIDNDTVESCRKSLEQSDLTGNTKSVGLAVKHHGAQTTLQITEGQSDHAGNTKDRSFLPQTTDETVKFHRNLPKADNNQIYEFFFLLAYMSGQNGPTMGIT
jgi:hypothetical protein